MLENCQFTLTPWSPDPLQKVTVMGSYSEEQSASPYPKQNESNPYHFLKTNFNLYHMGIGDLNPSTTGLPARL
jgi:hypothetical protein